MKAIGPRSWSRTRRDSSHYSPRNRKGETENKSSSNDGGLQAPAARKGVAGTSMVGEVNVEMEGLNEINADVVISKQVDVNLGVTNSNAVVQLDKEPDDHVNEDIHDGPSKLRPKWTRILRMDCGLQNSSDVQSNTILGKRRPTKTEEAEFNVEKETQVLKCTQQVFDVKSYGAQPNADITQALTKAWKAACAVAGSKVVISVGAPSDVASFNGKDGWVVFERIDGLTMSGGGVFDGKGQQAWQKNECQKDKNCNVLPINIRFNYVTNSKVQDITSKDSKFFHINLLECKKLQFQHVTIIAPVDSPNTDGIHVGRSSQITITNANIGTGDDCISVGDGTHDITVCIGSLGRYQNEEPVLGVRVIGATLSNTDNGVRIKTWPASTSRVASDIHFEDVVMNNSPSKVKISNVSFKKIRGTSSTKEAVNLICSKSVPCQQVVLSDIDLAYKGGGGCATSTCANVQPAVSGKQNPPACTNKH
nr:exopolygalacturonase [Quercus suber]